MIPAEGFFPPGHQWFGKPSFKLSHDVAAAKKLMAEAGYGPDKPLKTKILISASGSGQMQPLPMNEFVQQNLAEIGIKVEFEVVEWNTLINIWRAGAKHESARGAHGHELHLLHPGPLHRPHPPPAVQSGAADRDQLGLLLRPGDGQAFDQVRNTFDPKEQTAILQKIHEKYVDDALFLMVTHDVNPRAMSTKVQGLRAGPELVPGLLADHDGQVAEPPQTRRPSPHTAGSAPGRPGVPEATDAALCAQAPDLVVPVALGVTLVCFLLVHIAPATRSTAVVAGRRARPSCRRRCASSTASTSRCPSSTACGSRASSWAISAPRSRTGRPVASEVLRCGVQQLPSSWPPPRPARLRVRHAAGRRRRLLPRRLDRPRSHRWSPCWRQRAALLAGMVLVIIFSVQLDGCRRRAAGRGIRRLAPSTGRICGTWCCRPSPVGDPDRHHHAHGRGARRRDPEPGVRRRRCTPRA